MLRKLFGLGLLGVVLMLIMTGASEPLTPDKRAELRKTAQKAYDQGNYKDSLELFEQLILDPGNGGKYLVDDFNKGFYCLRNLRLDKDMDAYREKSVEAHPDDWRLLAACAENYLNNDHHGVIIAGKFERGYHRGGGKYVNSYERDRVRALQLYEKAMALVLKSDDPAGDRSGLVLQYARALMGSRGYSESWRLQYLTDLTELPDYEDGFYRGGDNRRAPVDQDNKPVFHSVPASYADAATDGERWRWAMSEAARIEPGNKSQTLDMLADFLHAQFGVQTMSGYGFFNRAAEEDKEKDESGPYDVHTLKETETLAKLATGIQRLTLPEEFNFVSIYKQIAGLNHGYAEKALDQLARIFENRRQYDRAVEFWNQSIERFGPGHNEWKKKQVNQIIDNWGRFDGTPTFAAGEDAVVGFTFRNGKKVEIEVREIKVAELLEAVKDYLKSNPRELEWERMQIEDIGWRCLRKDGDKFIGKKVSEFNVELQPREGHWNTKTEINTGLKKAGAYMVTAKMDDGNESRIVVWLNDTAIIKKSLNDKRMFFFVGDARTGDPVEKATLDFFGYNQVATDWQKAIGRRYNVGTTQFAEYTDKDGQVIMPQAELDSRYTWLITATAADGRLAFMGFEGVWYPDYYDREYNQVKTFVITDRPVYRPEQDVKFKIWVRNAKYDQEDKSLFAGKDVSVELWDAKNEKIWNRNFKADEYGGIDGEWAVGDDAPLGVYRFSVIVDGAHRGGGNFRVEEYKKPEFEVSVEAPAEPIALGEVIEATIKADYYFGAPVAKGKVKYKVTRTEQDTRWYPITPWDWFYGNGYWWFAYDYSWYPGWREWGCRRPYFWWFPGRHTPPEIVAEGEAQIGADGTYSVKIDTAPAKEIHGDTDHKYQITAEVVDESRRTIVGSGSVIAARKPFKVYAWVDRGHYRVGEVIQAGFSARRADQKPVQGKGSLKLFAVTYKKARDGSVKPVEKVVQEWDLDTNDEGTAELQIKASKAGQYRLSYEVTDSKDHAIEGGYVFCVTGDGFDGKQFKFNELELVPDRKEYKPGDKAQLMVNVDKPGGTILLFVRPANGVYQAPSVYNLTSGKSITHEIEITKKDMPNFFVEALTISNGKVYTETREIIVPPEKRVLNVEVLPSAKEYKPGEKAEIKLKVADSNGNPYSGSAVVAMYDRSVEYISGGSNVGDIKEFFWKWRRHHNEQTRDSITRWFGNMVLQGQIGMQDIGIFGNVATELDAVDGFAAGGGGGNIRRMAKGRSRGDAGNAPMVAMSAAMPMESKSEMAFADASGDMLREEEPSGGAGGGATVEAAVRKEFADTALWVASVKTDATGVAVVSCDMPENLTGWKIRTWVMGHGTVVGEGTAAVVTKKNVIIRLQAPRFFVEKDEVVLSGNIHNYLKTDKKIKAVLTLEGGCIEAMDKAVLTQLVDVKAGGEERVDWRVKVVKEGEAVIRMSALTDEESDAVEMKFPVYVHGMLKTESFCGVIRPADMQRMIEMVIPEARRPEQSRLEVRYSPTLAGAMVDALPYLVEYPYGCTEQTLNRFLPTVITQKILKDMGLDLKDIEKKRTNLNAQEIGDDQERAKQWKRYDRNPVFDEDTVTDMVKKGLSRLMTMQLSDGGWGWFSGWGERSYAHTTAYVVHGLQTAQANGVALVPGVLERGEKWLENYQAEELKELKLYDSTDGKKGKRHADDLDAFVYMVLVDAGEDEKDMREYLYRDRTHISVYAKAMFGIALHNVKDTEKLDMIIQNIEQFLVQDDENQSAWLELGNGGYWWCWYGSENEAHAYYLKLLSVTLKNDAGQVDAVRLEKASRLVKYLLNNRKHATYWNSTRDTAICIEAMADYLKASGEEAPDMTVQVLVNGAMEKQVSINRENLFSFDNKLVLEGDAVKSGKQTVEIKRTGKGPVYFNAYMTNFTLEDFITRAGLEVKVNRDVYKLVPVDKTIKASGSRGQVVDQKVEKYERVKLESGAELVSGDLVEVELVIESKNDYEYLVFEDMKAAGFEAVDVRSGYNGNDMGAYVEFRDERVCFFVSRLARGKHSVSYRLRAEVPGMFSALPTKAHAMYAPELKANSDEIKLSIRD